MLQLVQMYTKCSGCQICHLEHLNRGVYKNQVRSLFNFATMPCTASLSHFFPFLRRKDNNTFRRNEDEIQERAT